MTTRTMGPGAGWSWLKQAINLGRHNPKALFGAAALLLLAALVPTVLQLVVQNGLGITSMSVMFALLGFSLVYSLLVMPPLIGGFLRIIHATETGAPTRATAIFDAYKPGAGAWRIIGLVLLLMVVAVVLFGGIAFAFGAEFLSEIAAVIAAAQSAAPGTAPTLPPMPEGFGMLLALLVLVGLFFNGVYAISFGQVALSSRAIGGALADGFVGTLKNLLPLLVLLVIAFVLGIAFLLVLMLVVMLLAFIGGLVHPALAIVLAAPVYLGAMLVLYVIMFGVVYFMWRDICGDVSAPAVPDNRIAL